MTPSMLLLLTGTLIGLNFPLGKLAGQAGVSPVLWALTISFGAASALLPFLLWRGQLRWPSPRVMRYTVISALISFVGPNLLLLTVIAHAGAGYTGLMFALSPVFTVLFAALCRLRPPGGLGLAGIVVGLAGAVVVSLTRGADPAGPGLGWLLAALLIPVALAAGNVYRTIDWPADTPANVLAFWGHAFASLVFVGLLLTTRGGVPVAELAPVGGVALVQMAVAGLTFPVFFRLQQRGGPVLLSQIGYVAAAVGMIAATVFLGERYAPPTWIGAGIIVAGIGLTVLAQRRAHAVPRRA
ncbi:DMT family transporter [Nitrogeniibacter mangrovi]|uniref:DMT family transporter n=1 Tax=Nitrogeniibacter mangrovi TaxID=2016596 RepID=A0A6C1B463_9RHOO|nr:DMT family transporter [Nitrogeniibacter mangrovi]QID18471.1 DMT family transporter [Nitrogeniibacter mangrovi]